MLTTEELRRRMERITGELTDSITAIAHLSPAAAEFVAAAAQLAAVAVEILKDGRGGQTQ